MSESEVIMDSELMDGLAGEKIKVTLEGEPVGIELGAEEAADPEALALGVTAAAPREDVEEAFMVGKLGMEEVELDTLVTAGMEVEVEVLRADEEVADVDEGVIEVMEAVMEEDAMAEDEVEAMTEEEETTSSMFIIASFTSSTESDIDSKRS